MKLSCIIVAGGESRRMGFDKLSADLAGKPVLRRTVEAIRSCDLVGQVILVGPQERLDSCGIETGGDPPIIRVDGGSSRQDSVARGIAAAHPDSMFIAVHDGARPLVNSEMIAACFERARQFGAACAARRVSETLKRSDPEGFSRTTVDRDNLWITETPQIFRARILRRAFEKLDEVKDTVTDEVSAVELLGVSTYLVQSRTPNPKITHPWDLDQAASLLK
jgi:2-C-methyl-D-erythritol 4-phosphate cytidylyltransferase